jgi:hypothetical protein
MGELTAAAVLLALGWHWQGPGGLLLAAAGLSLAWALSRLLWPYKPCPRCKGSGRNPGSNNRRHGDCRRCKGTRRIRRSGARYVHRLKLSLIGRIRER